MMKKQKLMPLIGAVLIMALALGRNILAANGYIDDEISMRVVGAILGIIFVLLGNSIPKKLKPLSDTRCGSARGQSLRRFPGGLS